MKYKSSYATFIQGRGKDWRLPFFPDCEAHTMPAAVVAFTYVLD